MCIKIVDRKFYQYIKRKQIKNHKSIWNNISLWRTTKTIY